MFISSIAIASYKKLNTCMYACQTFEYCIFMLYFCVFFSLFEVSVSRASTLTNVYHLTQLEELFQILLEELLMVSIKNRTFADNQEMIFFSYT